MRTDRRILLRRALCAVMAIAVLSLCANAGIPEKYGEIQQDNKGQNFRRVKFLLKCIPVKKDYYYKLPEISYIHYYPDGKILWEWNRLGDDFITIKGQRSDSVGSFTVKAGDIIGDANYTGTNSYWDAKICVYPMMQYNGENILIIDKDFISFNVGVDEKVSMEWSDVPSEAIPGFGPIYKDNHSTHGFGDAWDVDDGTTQYSPYGLEWQMFTDFSMTPLLPDQNSVEDIGEESADKDNQFYDIFGRKVSGLPQTPGIYICNGRKILIK